MRLWVVKANENPESGSGGWHWDNYLFGTANDGQEWGGPDWVRSHCSKKLIREDVRKNDLVVCYQTERPRGAIRGLTRMASDGKDDPPDSGDYNLLNFVPPEDALNLDSGLDIRALYATGCHPKCFGPGSQGTIFPIEQPDFDAIIKALIGQSCVQEAALFKWLRGAGYLSRSQAQTAKNITSVRLPDDDDAPPRKVNLITQRVVRNTAKGESLKRLYDCKCQVCGYRVAVPRAGSGVYAEVHHLRLLGANHGGWDNRNNMLVLCPNCHAEFDAHAMAIDPRTERSVCYGRNPKSGKKLKFRRGHVLAPENVQYSWNCFIKTKAGPAQTD